MATPAERLALLLKVHGDSYRTAAELSGVDHTTIMRVERGETENPATLAKIAEGYGVPMAWMRGNGDLATDFVFAVLSRPLNERVLFLWEPSRRAGFALNFLGRYEEHPYTCARLAELVQVPQSEMEGILKGEFRPIPMTALERLCCETGLPVEWFRTGLVGREDQQEMMVGLAEWALTTLAQDLGVEVSPEEIHEAAVALA